MDEAIISAANDAMGCGTTGVVMGVVPEKIGACERRVRLQEGGEAEAVDGCRRGGKASHGDKGGVDINRLNGRGLCAVG